MIIYLDRDEVPDIENIDPEIIRWLVEKAEFANNRYSRLWHYYLGDHDILHRPKETESDVNVAVNYAKYVVDTTLGYYLGDAVKYNVNDTHEADDGDEQEEPNGSEDEPEAGQEIDLQPLLATYDKQHIARTDSRIGKGMGIFGDCLELCYASDDKDPVPRSAYINPMNGILVEDSTVEHRKLFAMQWDLCERSTGLKYYRVDLYTDKTIKHYEALDIENAVYNQVGPTENHYFDGVPMIAYENNDERQGDFEQIISMIDAYDELMSDRFTDKKKFVNALLAFFGFRLEEGGEETMRKEKFIEGLPLDARVEYIQKAFDESSVQVLANAAVREMHKMTMTVDMSDENFAGNSSGQALKLKLLTMNLLVKGKVTRMEEGLRERLVLYNNWLIHAGKMSEVPLDDIDVVFTVSTPIDEAGIVNIVTSLQGIVDDETLLSQLWFIKDPAEAVRNIKKQKVDNMEFYQQTMGALGSEEETGAMSQIPTVPDTDGEEEEEEEEPGEEEAKPKKKPQEEDEE